MTIAKLEVDKENRPPRGMAKGKGNMTPGRRRKAQDQYFDVGKVGRKTGITLPDKGVRDEHGMEPISGIFSSPIPSPRRNGERTLTSSDMNIQNSSAPDVDQTLHLRRTPRLPPARASTPRHTNIGSPKRMSTSRPHTTGKRVLPLSDDERTPERAGSRTQPPANRKLSFGAEKVVTSIEALSPFRPKNVLRRSFGAVHPDPFASPVREPQDSQTSPNGAVDQEPQELDLLPQIEDDEPLVDMDNGYQPMHDDATPDAEDREPGSERKTPIGPQTTLSTDGSINVLSRHTTPSKKRDRTSMECESVHVDEDPPLEPSGYGSSPSSKRSRSRLSVDGMMEDQGDVEITIDPSLLAQGDERVEETPQEEIEQPRKKGKGRKGKAAALKDRDPNRAIRAQTSPVKLRDGPSQGSKSPGKRTGRRGVSVGPVSNMSLRATTPFEDATATTRSGRPVIKPLQYWANETRVWKNGECEGIIRAEEVVKPKPHGNRGRRKPKKRQRVSKLEDISEESETESTMADEWEEEVGVIAGNVASWDPETQMGNPHDPIHEDLAFASSAIVTRDVAGSEFKYAKIMTMPFFGSGVVELPPEGFKRAKNSRKMQMCFFVHEGKVMVEVGGQGMQGDVNTFAISKGGVWVVPRGEFARFLQKIFFLFSSCMLELGYGEPSAMA
ncbi:MAG: hypothetical protein FE78DRAFT_511319 [Acidomyces sp. 'richmondensis']|nr:MAG: hypothetical protein FE78DRAFT_511319 [Acidomyces sp. 'richmondensis']